MKLIKNKKLKIKMKKIVTILSIVALTSCGGVTETTPTTTDSTKVCDSTSVSCDSTKVCSDSTKTSVDTTK
jgi:hypothetical protein